MGVWDWARLVGWGFGAGVTVALARGLFFPKSAYASGPYLDTSGGEPPSWWTPDDYRALDETSGRLGVNSANLLSVLRSESGLRPDAVFPGGLARGLSQITEAGRAAAGLSESEWREFQTWPIQRQLPAIERYMSVEFDGKPPTSAGGIYAFNFLPARAKARGTAPTTVLAEVSEFGIDAGLDYDGDGRYEVSDLSRHLARYGDRKKDGGPVDPLYLGALAELRRATGKPGLSPMW